MVIHGDIVEGTICHRSQTVSHGVAGRNGLKGVQIVCITLVSI